MDVSLWREPPSPLRVLVSAGWLTESDARDRRLRVDATASSHALFRVTAPDGRAVVVKQVRREAAAAGRSLNQELFVYRLANWLPALAGALPAAALIDEQHQILVLESLGEGVEWPIMRMEKSHSIGSRNVARALGGVMARWHQATQELGLWPSPAVGILHLPEDLELAAEARPHATQVLMRSLVDDPEFSSALREVRANWRDRCLIHGDIRRENWIVTRSGRAMGVKVLDWELSGSGDPAWDLGSVLAETALDTVRSGPERVSSWSGEQQAAIRAFFQAYIASGGLLDAREAHQWSHVVMCGIARLLHVACEWADQHTTSEAGPVQAVLAHARLGLQQRTERVRTLMAMRLSQR